MTNAYMTKEARNPNDEWARPQKADSHWQVVRCSHLFVIGPEIIERLIRHLRLRTFIRHWVFRHFGSRHAPRPSSPTARCSRPRQLPGDDTAFSRRGTDHRSSVGQCSEPASSVVVFATGNGMQSWREEDPASVLKSCPRLPGPLPVTAIWACCVGSNMWWSSSSTIAFNASREGR